MQTFNDEPLSSHVPPSPLSHRSRGGGRKASDRYRRAIELSESFTGLPAGTSRFDLLLLVKRGGREAGFTPKMIQLLEYYLVALTRDVDWEQGRPIVYQGLSKTAMELSVSERQIQALEKALFDVGALGYVDSGNCRRFGYRDTATGQIVYAFGPDLSPLAALRPQLEEAVRRKEAYNREWLTTKRNIWAARRQIRAILLEWQSGEADRAAIDAAEAEYARIAVQLRTHLDLAALGSLLERHAELLKTIEVRMGVGGTRQESPIQTILSRAMNLPTTQKHASPSTNSCAHNEYINQVNTFCSRGDQGFQEGIPKPPVLQRTKTSCGVEYVTLAQARRAASDRFRDQLLINSAQASWSEVIEAAYRVRTHLGISQASWGEACEVVGRSAAALCLLVTDRATLRQDNRVRQPAAYFRGLVDRARAGELHLHRSIFGLLEQDGLRA
jgi:replication initiation protein RepC